MTSLSGKFQSPNYPLPYPYNTRCEFNISLPVGNRIRLFIEDIELKSENDCKFDYLGIYNGSSAADATELATICSSNNTGRQFNSTGKYLIVVFKSGLSRGFRGFKANYTAEILGRGR